MTGMHIYVNDIEQSVTVTSGVKNPVGSIINGTELWIGHDAEVTIDEVRIYNRVFSPQEISNLYNQTSCIHKSDTNCDGCVDMTELTAFIDRWHINNLDVTLKELIEAIGLWKRGGC